MTTDSRGANVFAPGHVGDNCRMQPRQLHSPLFGPRANASAIVKWYTVMSRSVCACEVDGSRRRVRHKIELTEVRRPAIGMAFQCAAIANRTKLFGMIVMFGFNQTARMWCAELIGSTLSG